MIKLEDATKEELIWWMKQNIFMFGHDERQFHSDILFRRSEKILEKQQDAGNRCSAALDKYLALLQPYEGKRLLDIPSDVVEKGAALEREMKAASKERDSLYKEWERLNREIEQDLR